MSGIDSFKIRNMNREELDIAIEWAATEGWNPGLYDADCFYSADVKGFLVGLLDGEPVASISAVKYDIHFGFVGFYIVKPDFRGQGYGLKIWNKAVKSLKGLVVGLDGVVDQQCNYKKSGFSLAHRNIRYQGYGGGNLTDYSNLVSLTNFNFREICRYDRCFFATERTRFLKCWLEQPLSSAIGILYNGKLAGYGLMRKCRSGYKIGPLFADNTEFAEHLFLYFKCQIAEEDPIILDTPEANPAAIELAERYNLQPIFETARMYKGKHPDLALERTFGMTTFELG
ncbi:MAG: GNAT family N-acetyltransferase [Thermodesulfobacteriota bacterium]